jgi:hypothetical protein
LLIATKNSETVTVLLTIQAIYSKFISMITFIYTRGPVEDLFAESATPGILGRFHGVTLHYNQAQRRQGLGIVTGFENG